MLIITYFINDSSSYELVWFVSQKIGAGLHLPLLGTSEDPATNKGAHAWTWALAYHLMALKFPRFQKRDSKRKLQISLIDMKIRNLKLNNLYKCSL